jgi:SnoaL-like domain
MRRVLYVSVLMIILVLTCVVGAVACSDQMSDEAQKAAVRANDIADCNNLMSLHVWYHSGFLNDVELEKFWCTLPENTATAVWAQNANYWIGMDNIKAYYGETKAIEATQGQFQFHTVTSGVVEIAEDRKTAKGVWYTPGAIGMGGTTLQGMWERYGIDFVNENGAWKIWHLHVYTDFGYSMTSGSSTGAGGAPPGGGAPPAGGAPTGAPPTGAAPPAGATATTAAGDTTATTAGQAETFGAESGGTTARPNVAPQATASPGYSEWGASSYAYLIPRPPEPYATFSETWSYGDPNEIAMFATGYQEWSAIQATLGGN